MYTKRRVAGFSLVEVLVVVGIVAVLMGILIPLVTRARETSKRAGCANNLRRIGQAFQAYTTDNRGEYPRLRWDRTGAVTNVPPDAPDPFSAGGTNDITAALFLLIRTQDLPANVFICPSSGDVTDTLGGQPAQRRSDFSSTAAGWDDARTFSYSYANPYPGESGSPGSEPEALMYRLSAKVIKPDFAVAADINPGCCEGDNPDDVIQTDPDAPMSRIRQGNSNNHRKDGQNVLYADGRVVWSNTLFAGVGRDNIYSPKSNERDGKPDHPDDSVLLPED